MNDLRLWITGHLILGPFAVYIIGHDMAHPEWWVIWYRNPYISIPFIAVVDGICTLYCIMSWRRDRRGEEGIRLLKEALRLQEEGNYEAADILHRRGRRLTGLDRIEQE